MTVLSMGLTPAYAARDFVQPTIPQPQTLPGDGVNTKKTLTESLLPKYAVGLIGFVSMAALVFLVIAGVRFATAYGNEEAVETAKKQVIYSIVALLIALLSYTIVSIIINLKFVPEPPAPTATQALAATAPPAAGSLGEAAGVPEQPAI